MPRSPTPWLFLLALLLPAWLPVAGCGQATDSAAKPAAQKRTLITVAEAKQTRFEIIEETVGTVESPINPTVMAEVPGRVTRVTARAGAAVRQGELLAVIDADDLKLARRSAAAEAARIDALLANQNTVVERNRELVKSNFISRNALDESIAQQRALAEQLDAAKAQLARVESDLARTRVLSPLDGRVDVPIVSEGDYVAVGTPMFRLLSTRVLNVYLPFPETVAPRLRVGLPVRLSSPSVSAAPIEATVSELKPAVGASTRALNAIVRLRDAPGCRPGASVTASVVLDVREAAVVVPEQSVVLRPAGTVVYVIGDGKAAQRVVTTGFKRDGMIEIATGLQPGEVVALDGAGFLTDGAPVTVQSPES
jgi:membrane fusion protein, multidrug efflux system